MKKSLTVLTVVLFGSLFIIACNQKVELKTENEKVVEFGVVSVHDLTLKAGVDEKEFETFIMNEVAPIYDKMRGQKLTLVKGDRGIRTNQYAIILTFESIEDRDRIYPPSGEFVGDFGEDSMWEKFDLMIEDGLGKLHTDYVKVVH